MAAKKKPKKARPRLRFYSSRLNDKYFKWTKAIKNRDKKCQMPGCRRKTKLECHHIIPYAQATNLRYDEKNGILLCNKCHRSIKGKERHFIKVFQVIVNEKYAK